jgi:hypothetical protein
MWCIIIHTTSYQKRAQSRTIDVQIRAIFSFILLPLLPGIRPLGSGIDVVELSDRLSLCIGALGLKPFTPIKVSYNLVLCGHLKLLEWQSSHHELLSKCSESLRP